MANDYCVALSYQVSGRPVQATLCDTSEQLRNELPIAYDPSDITFLPTPCRLITRVRS
jgi:hypothetical protein